MPKEKKQALKTKFPSNRLKFPPPLIWLYYPQGKGCSAEGGHHPAPPPAPCCWNSHSLSAQDYELRCVTGSRMANSTMEIVAVVLTLVGLIGAAASTGMPMWRVTAFIGENIIVMETRWEGLWMNCFRQANIRMQCKVYDSLLALPQDLQAARGLMCTALALCGIGILISVVGMQCTSCIMNNDRAKRLVLVIAGSLILMSCICVLIPVSWTGHVIIRDFYNPLLIDAQRRELGEALYIGWVASAFLFAGGCIFICCNIQSDEKDSRRYLYSKNADYKSYTPMPLQPQQLVMIPQARPQPMLSRQPSTVYSYNSRHELPPLQPQELVMIPQPQPQPMLSRQPSTIYSYNSRYPSVRSGVAYLWSLMVLFCMNSSHGNYFFLWLFKGELVIYIYI